MREKLQKLCQGVRALGPGIEIQLKPSDDAALDHWAILVCASSVILIHTDYQPIEEAIDEACVKIAKMSQKMMAAVRSTGSSPPSSDPPLSPPPSPPSPRKK